MNRKQIKDKIKAFFACSYRLAVWTAKGSLFNIEGETINEINAKLAEYGLNLHGHTWTLYKTGRFFLPEREIDRSNN